MLPQASLRFFLCALTGTGLAACLDMEPSASSTPTPGTTSTAGNATTSSTAGSSASGGNSTGQGGASGASGAASSSTSGSAGSSSAGSTSASGSGGSTSSGGAAAGGGGAGPTFPFVDPPGEQCDVKTIRLGEMQIFTNEWNDPRAETCVFLKEDGAFGWRWVNGDFGTPVPADMPLLMVNKDWPNYPELEFGINPWNAKGIDVSTTTLLPRKLGEINEASMTVDVSTDVSGGKWNLAFEMWLSDKNPFENPGSKAVAEIMVFFGNDAGYWPTEPQSDEKVSDGSHEYRLYQTSDTWGVSGDQKYRQYRIANGATSFKGKLDIGKFLEHYKQQGWNQDLWVTRFEIGNEVYSNVTGTTTIRSITFTVNGEGRSAKTKP